MRNLFWVKENEAAAEKAAADFGKRRNIMSELTDYTDLSCFFRSRVRDDLQESILISERFCQEESEEPSEFVIRGVSEAENAELKEASRRPAADGTIRFDQKAYCDRLIIAATVYPNFKNLELQRSWGALNAEELLGKMLLAGEYAKLLAAVKRLSGFDETIGSLKNAVKK